MKNQSALKRFLLLILAMALLAGLCGAASADGIDAGSDSFVDEGALLKRLREIPDFKFRNHEEGIGGGMCPVYTAPSLDAYRAANGRAECRTDEKIGEGGYVGGWLLVRYETYSGSHRVGYISPRYVSGFRSTMPSPRFDHIQATAADTIQVTDNPVDIAPTMVQLEAGDSFTILGKYTYSGSWWYIECLTDGQVSRGFIDRDASAFRLGSGTTEGTVYTMSNLGDPETSPRGTGKIGVVRPEAGNRKNVRQSPDTGAAKITVAYYGSEYPCYDKVSGGKDMEWYYIFVESDSKWGWISSGVSTLTGE